jgi:HSP20 family protein
LKALEYEAVSPLSSDRLTGDDLRRILNWLEGESLAGGGAVECRPSLDVFETATAVEVIADLAGVPADRIRVVFSEGVLVIAGQKLPCACEHGDAAFHLAERAFGRFARIVRLSGAIDAGRARATLTAGELHVVLPRIDERRGAEIRIPITAT